MKKNISFNAKFNNDPDLQDWLDALENKILFDGKDSAKLILEEVFSHARNMDLLPEKLNELPFSI